MKKLPKLLAMNALLLQLNSYQLSSKLNTVLKI